MKKHPFLYGSIIVLVLLLAFSGYTYYQKKQLDDAKKANARLVAAKEVQDANATISAKDLANKIIDKLNEQKTATLTVQY